MNRTEANVLPADFVEKLVRMANSNADGVEGPAVDGLRATIDSAEIVFGIWQDADSPYGVNYHVIKGLPGLHAVVDSGVAAAKSITAVRCRNFEEAEAMRRVFGDVKHQH